MWAVRIALAIGVGVVLSMISHPIQHRPLDRQRAEHGKRPLEPRIGLKRAVREQPVKPNRHANRGQEIHDCEDCQVDRIDRSVPEQNDGEQNPEERDDDPDQVVIALGTSHSTRTSYIYLYFLQTLSVRAARNLEFFYRFRS